MPNLNQKLAKNLTLYSYLIDPFIIIVLKYSSIVVGYPRYSHSKFHVNWSGNQQSRTKWFEKTVSRDYISNIYKFSENWNFDKDSISRFDKY